MIKVLPLHKLDSLVIRVNSSWDDVKQSGYIIEFISLNDSDHHELKTGRLSSQDILCQESDFVTLKVPRSQIVIVSQSKFVYN